MSTSSAPLTPFSIGSEPFVWGLSPPTSFPEGFFEGTALLFDDVALVGTGLSLLEPELVEFERAFSPFVEDDVSLLDLRFRLSPGIVAVLSKRASRTPSGE